MKIQRIIAVEKKVLCKLFLRQMKSDLRMQILLVNF